MHCHGYWIQLGMGMSNPFIRYLHPIPGLTSLQRWEFVDNAVCELLKGGYSERTEGPPVVCSPLSVVTNGVGKKRSESETC